MSEFGLLLLVVGAALAVAEAHVPTHGALGVRGRRGGGHRPGASWSAARAFGLALALTAGLAGGAVGAAYLWVVVHKALAARHARVRSGRRGPDRARRRGPRRARPARPGLPRRRAVARAPVELRRGGRARARRPDRGRARRRPDADGPPCRGLGGLLMSEILFALRDHRRCWSRRSPARRSRVLREYERAVVFRFGCARKQLATPGGDQPAAAVRLSIALCGCCSDTRTRAIQIAPEEIITHDNIFDQRRRRRLFSRRWHRESSHAVLEVEEVPASRCSSSRRRRCARCSGRWTWTRSSPTVSAINSEALRRHPRHAHRAVGRRDLGRRDQGHLQLPKEMQRAMARQAEAERERRAKVIAAEGEVQAASKLAQAAEKMIDRCTRSRSSCAFT